MEHNEMMDTEESEKKQWLEYKATGNIEIRNNLIKKYTPLVKYVAGRLAVNLKNSMEYDDMVGYGILGLIDSVEKFDINKNVKFKTYAVTRIQGSIIDYIRELDWIPRTVRQKAKEVEMVIKELDETLGHSPSEAEIAAKLGISLTDFHSLLNKISFSNILSLNQAWYSGDENEGITLEDTIEASDKMLPDKEAEQKEIRSLLAGSIQNLPKNEKTVLVLYYYEEMNFSEIGKVIGVTESRISQLHTMAISRLRARFTSRRHGII